MRKREMKGGKMKKKFIIWIIVLVVLLIAASFIYAYLNNSDGEGLFAAKPGAGCVPNGYECGDCVDNDGDGKIDYKVNRNGVATGDLNCESLTDNCESSVCCTPESDTAFCTRLGKSCGSVTANDNCGTSRTINCGTCQAGYICTNGNCVQTCTNGCSPSGSKICSGSGYKTCGNYDADTCLEWSNVTNCLAGQTCSGGNCIISNSCSDTDGSNSLVQGTVSGYFNGESYGYTDACIDNSSLIENYCSGTFARSFGVNCSEWNATTTVCSDGKCI